MRQAVFTRASRAAHSAASRLMLYAVDSMLVLVHGSCISDPTSLGWASVGQRSVVVGGLLQAALGVRLNRDM